MNLDAKFYLSLFLRRFHYFLIVALAVSAVGLTLAYTLPTVYRSQATLLVESPQIPDDLAQSTVRAETPEMLGVIQQRLLARSNLLDISRRLGVHAGMPAMTADEIVEDMRRRIEIDLPSRRDQANVVTVSFDAPGPQQAADVASELVNQVLQQNVELRTSVTGQTLDFFQQEVQRLIDEMGAQDAEILQFKLQNKDALPDSLDYRRTRQAAQQERLLQVDRELAALRDRRDRLSDLYARTGGLGGEEALTPEQSRLQDLRSELASALVVYSEQNPRVRNLKAQVEALEKVVARQLGSSDGADEMSAFDVQMADIDGQLEYLAEQKRLIETELESLAASIDATPGNAIELGRLERDFENLRVQYNQAVGGLAEARTGDRIEATSRGQRISVIEQPGVPSSPYKPNRRKIAAAGVGGGILLGLGLVVLLELLNRSVRRPSELVTGLGLSPFGTVPYIRTRREIFRRRAAIGGAVVLVGAGLPLMLYMLHLYYMPMDMMVEQLAERLGFARFVSRLQG